MDDSQKVEELLHHFRMEQKDFAEKCGFEPNVISSIKRGKCGISNRVFSKIITAFPDVNKSWLRDGEGEMLNNSVNQSIIENNNGNFQQGEYINDIRTFETVITEVKKEFATKEERFIDLLKEKDERIRELQKEKDERLKEKDEHLKEKDSIIQDMTKRYDKLQERLFELQDKLLQSQETLLSYIKTDK